MRVLSLCLVAACTAESPDRAAPGSSSAPFTSSAGSSDSDPSEEAVEVPSLEVEAEVTWTACAAYQPGFLCTFAGIPAIQQFSAEGLPATEAALNLPMDAEMGPDGRVYIVDHNNHRIRVVDEDGLMWTVSGTGSIGDGVPNPDPVVAEGVAGPAGEARWNHPAALAFSPIDPGGVWISAFHNSRINRIDVEADWVDFVVGDGSRAYCGEEGPAVEACLDLPSGVAFGPDGQLYLFDQANQLLRRVDLDGVINIVGGTPKTAGYAGDGGPVAAALFNGEVNKTASPSKRIAIRGNRLVMADTWNHVIRELDLETGIIQLLAGTFVPSDAAYGFEPGGLGGFEGDGGDALSARFHDPSDVAIAPDGTVFVADSGNACVRKITPDGIVEMVVGQCTVPGAATPGASATASLLDTPMGVSVGPYGELYVTDTVANAVFVVWGAAEPEPPTDE